MILSAYFHKSTVAKYFFIFGVIAAAICNFEAWASVKIPVPKKIVFIVHTESLGGKAVDQIYKEMKKVGHDVKIVAIPSFYYGEPLADVDLKFTSKFDEKDVVYPCGKKTPYRKCTNINELKPDYIFIQNPYDTYRNSVLDPHFLTPALEKISKKTMFIVYGPHLFHQDSINDPNLPNLIDTVFVDSQSTKNIYIERYKFPSNRVVVSGYPSYKAMRDAAKDLKSNEKTGLKQETILWLPRWTLSFMDRDKFEGGSTFLNYHYFFYDFARKNPNIHLIIRPHQLLFSFGVKGGYISQEDMDNIFDRFKSLKNVTISMHKDQSLIDDVNVADIVVSDGTSALGEVVVADKPIVYLSNGWNNEFNSNELSREFKKHLDFAYCPADILKHFDRIRSNNYCLNSVNQDVENKPLNENAHNRDEFKKMLDPVENPAKFIAEYLLYETG